MEVPAEVPEVPAAREGARSVSGAGAARRAVVVPARGVGGAGEGARGGLGEGARGGLGEGLGERAADTAAVGTGVGAGTGTGAGDATTGVGDATTGAGEAATGVGEGVGTADGQQLASTWWDG